VANGSTRKYIFLPVAATLFLLCGFAAGFLACVSLRGSSLQKTISPQLLQPADAPAAVRAGVLDSLRAFQDGYIKRDQRDLDSFLSRLFPRDGDVLILGTEGGTAEWIRGYPFAARFIARDWRDWGDFRFDVDRSLVWSGGDVAWVASTGSVRFKGSYRPVRITAIMTQEGGRWVFRQLQFQWDESNPDAGDILHLHTYLRLAHMALGDLVPFCRGC
jgi:SnoaL-like domain